MPPTIGLLPSPFASGDGTWGSGDPIGDPVFYDLRAGNILAVAGPPGSGKRVAVRDAVRTHQTGVPVLVRVDGRELVDLADAVAALLGMAAVVTAHSGRPTDDLSAAWSVHWKYGARAERRDWRATLTCRRVADRVGGPPATLATVMQLWDAMAVEMHAVAVLVIECADVWITRLSAADRDGLAEWYRADTAYSARLLLLGRQAAPLASVVGLERVEVLAEPSAEIVSPWLQERFTAGGWDLPSNLADLMLIAVDGQLRALVRIADHLWRQLRSDTTIIVLEQLHDAARAAIREWSPVYEAAWGDCTPVQRSVLRLVKDERGQRLTKRRPTDFPLGTSAIQRAVEGLQSKGLVWREAGHGGRVRLTDALFGHWLRLR